MQTGDVSDIKCLHFSCQYNVWLISKVWSINECYWQIWKVKESFKNCPGKMTYFHSPSRQVHISRLCWLWHSSNENSLPSHSTAVYEYTTGALYAPWASQMLRFPSDLTLQYTHFCVVGGSQLLPQPPSSHKYTLVRGSSRRLFQGRCVRHGLGRGGHLTPDFPPPLSGSIFIYWNLEVSIYSIKTSSEIHTGA